MTTDTYTACRTRHSSQAEADGGCGHRHRSPAAAKACGDKAHRRDGWPWDIVRSNSTYRRIDTDDIAAS